MRGSKGSISCQPGRSSLSRHLSFKPALPGITLYLESQPGLDLLLEDIGNRAVEVGKYLHRKLRVDSVVCDKIIEGIRQRRAEAGMALLVSQSAVIYGSIEDKGWCKCTCYGDIARSSSEHQKPSCLVVILW